MLQKPPKKPPEKLPERPEKLQKKKKAQNKTALFDIETGVKENSFLRFFNFKIRDMSKKASNMK
jgi:hypothetical protein